MEGRETPKKEKDYARFVGGDRFNKQDNLHMGFVLGSCKTSRSMHPPSKSYKFI